VVSISGMTLTKGATVGNSVNDRGGSIQINDESVTLDGLDVNHNTVAVRGGAISLQGAAKLTFLNGSLSNNAAGASYSGGAICSDAPGHAIIVRDSTITGNSAIA